MCIIRREPDLDGLNTKSEVKMVSAKNDPVGRRTRMFAAASVPHLHLHGLPKLGTTTTGSIPTVLKPGSPSVTTSGGDVEPQNVKRKSTSPSLPSPSAVGTPVTPSLSVTADHHYHHHGDVSPMQRLIASGIGTVFMTCFMMPLDVVKVRLQAQHKVAADDFKSPRRHRVPRVGSNPISSVYRRLHTTLARPEKGFTPTYTRLNGTFDAFIKITRTEGLTKLWSGLPATLLMRVPANIVYFSVYDGLKSQLGFQSYKASSINSVMITIVASGTARALSITLVSPLDLIRTKLQSQSLTYSQLRHCLNSGFKAEGVVSLWRGLGPTILRDVPYAILYWTNYELLKTQVMRFYDVTEATVSMTFWSGTASGVFASVVTTPFDVVKTSKQIAIGDISKHKDKGVKCATRQNTWRLMKQIYSQSGFRGLFSGVGPRVAMSAPASAILITSYEFCLSVFREYNDANCGLV